MDGDENVKIIATPGGKEGEESREGVCNQLVTEWWDVASLVGGGLVDKGEYK